MFFYFWLFFLRILKGGISVGAVLAKKMGRKKFFSDPLPLLDFDLMMVYDILAITEGENQKGQKACEKEIFGF